jgi:A/G-specific adenine glycosylase
VKPAEPDFSPGQLLALQRKLLAWFGSHQRDLPWRRDRDPYHIWVSEVMLQQTQVATVVPYFERFLAAFPTVADLAAADEAEVLRLWEGLGYYRRARHLHQAARQLVQAYPGALPPDPGLWRQLPGVGRYILGAVLSQAFDLPLPIVEANSQRVLCRLFGQRRDPRRGPTRRWLWQVAAELLPRRQAGDFNQALMELGALVCRPAAPDCPACPLARHCAARRQGLQERIPPAARGPRPVAVRETAVVVARGRQVLLVQRPDHGRWANLWEFPRGTVTEGEEPAAAARRLLPELTGVRGRLAGELLTLRHSVTHHRITLVCFAAHYVSGRFRSSFYRRGSWLEPAELAGLPVSAAQRQLARLIQKNDADSGPRRR